MPHGVTLSNFQNVDGTITADIQTECSATAAEFTLQASDGTLTTTTTLSVSVNANTAPTIGNYNHQTASFSGAVTASPASAPTDNGTIASVTVSVSPNTFAGSLKVDLTTGAVTIMNAAPVGMYTITVTVKDNCEQTTQKNFALEVKQPVPTPTSTLIKLVPDDPLFCAGDAINGAFGSTNTSGVPVSGRVFATLNGLVAVQGSVVCTLNPASGGATTFCGIENGAPTWRGTLAAGQRVDVAYQAQVADGATSPVCSIARVQFPDVTGEIISAEPFCLTINCPTPDPGVVAAATAASSTQKPGSVLLFPIYTSSLSNPATENTRIYLTNTDTARPAFVHLFFVDGVNCSVADNFICLSPNQTTSFLASDIDPGVTGYVIAVATNERGCPISFNQLVGGEYIKFNSGHEANLTAEAIAAIPGGLPLCDATAVTATLRFDNVSCNALPRVLATSGLAAPADGNQTMLILNRLNGNLQSNGESLGILFGVIYDQLENPYSFNFSGGCQLRTILNNSFPRTVPRLSGIIPTNTTGWLKLWATGSASDPEPGLFGAAINFNPNAASNANAYNQGRNLHKLTFTTKAVLQVPVFAPNCQ